MAKFVKTIVPITEHMLFPGNERMFPDNEVVIPAGLAALVVEEHPDEDSLNCRLRFVEPHGTKRAPTNTDWWVTSAWTVVSQPPRVKWFVQLHVLFGDDEQGDYQRLTQTVEATGRNTAIDLVVTDYESKRLLDPERDTRRIIDWIEIDVHVVR